MEVQHVSQKRKLEIIVTCKKGVQIDNAVRRMQNLLGVMETEAALRRQEMDIDSHLEREPSAHDTHDPR